MAPRFKHSPSLPWPGGYSTKAWVGEFKICFSVPGVPVVAGLSNRDHGVTGKVDTLTFPLAYNGILQVLMVICVLLGVSECLPKADFGAGGDDHHHGDVED